MTRDGTATRARILDAAEHLVIENGYTATSVDQILARSRSSKGAFFHHFSSKQQLAKALVDRYVDGDVAQLTQALDTTRHLTDPAERAVALVRHFEEMGDSIMSAQSSCLYVAVLTERQLTDADTRSEILRAVVTWRQEVGAILREALATRAPDDAPDPEDLADHLFATFEGSYLLCRATGSPHHMRAQLRVFRQMLERLFAIPAGD